MFHKQLLRSSSLSTSRLSNQMQLVKSLAKKGEMRLDLLHNYMSYILNRF